MSPQTHNPDTDGRIENCNNCEEETSHSVHIKLKTEGQGPFSNEPYRIAKCDQCGAETETRMNNA